MTAGRLSVTKKKHEGSLIKIASPSARNDRRRRARNDSGDKPFTSIYKGLISNTLSEFHGRIYSMAVYSNYNPRLFNNLLTR